MSRAVVTEAGRRAFFARPALEVAPQLLGATLTRRTDQGAVTVRVTEVEAYEGRRDPGSHAYRGRTARNEVMFGEPGRLYVYRHLGLHHCVNVVCGPAGSASAVLLRAGEVVAGAELARARRSAAGVCRRDVDLARGPARLAVALGLTLADNGVDACRPGGMVTIRCPGPGGFDVAAGPRVGVSGAGGDPAVHPWRFWVAGDPTVSAYRRAPAGGTLPATRGRDPAGCP